MCAVFQLFFELILQLVSTVSQLSAELILPLLPVLKKLINVLADLTQLLVHSLCSIIRGCCELDLSCRIRLRFATHESLQVLLF